MAEDFLATGFSDVDRAADTDFFASCLALLDALPYYRQIKRRSYELLDLKPGLSVLDAGCGLGGDAFRMAEKVRPGGRVVGLDASADLIARAKADPRAMSLPVTFRQGDLKSVPDPDAAYDRCRVDRVLQHVPEPEAAVRELIRVLKPGGLLLAYDNDWDAFEMTAHTEDRDTTRMIERLWRESFVNRNIGQRLAALYCEAGLKEIETIASTSVIRDFETADKVYNLRATAQKAVASGDIDEDRANVWVQRMLAHSARGVFEVALTAYTVVGRR